MYSVYKYAYLFGVGIFAIVWFVFFFIRKDLRKQQLFLSLFLAPFAPITDVFWFYKDYWRPQYILIINILGVPVGFEGMLFAFFIGGIAGVIYEVIFRKRHDYSTRRDQQTIVLIVAGLLLAEVLRKIGLNTIWATSITFMLMSVIMMIIDRDLVKDVIYSGIFMTILAILFYFVWLSMFPGAIQKFWVVKSLSGVKLWKIPLEELVWFFSAGLSGGALYEFWLNAKPYQDKV